MIGCQRWRPDLVRRQATVIVAMDTASVLAARAATTQSQSSSTLAATRCNLVWSPASARPGGHLTGGGHPERGELAAEAQAAAVNGLRTAANIIALLSTRPTQCRDDILKSLRGAARDLGLQVHVNYERAPADDR